MTVSSAPDADTPGAPPWQSAGTVLGVLEQIAKEANTGDDPQRVLSRVVSAVTEWGPWSICWAGLVDVDHNRLSVHADSGFAAHPPPRPVEEWTAFDSPSWVAVETRAPYMIYDAFAETGFPLVLEDAKARGFRSVLILPLFVGDHVGVIWFCDNQPRTFSDDEVAFAEVVASLTSVALSNTEYQRRQRELLERERRQSAELRRLNELADTRYQDLQRLSDTRARLLDAVVNDRGIDGLARIVEHQLSAATFIVDRFGNLLSTGHGGVDEDTRHGADGGIGPAIVTGARGIARAEVGTVDVDETHFTVATIDSGDTRLGYLCCTTPPDALDTIGRDLLSQASLHLAIEMMKDRIRLESHLRVFGDFVTALTSGSANPRTVERAAAAAGISIAQPVGVFRGRFEPSQPERIEDALEFSRQLHRLVSPAFPENIIMPVGGSDLLVLVQWPPAKPATSALTGEIRRAITTALRMIGAEPGTVATFTIGIGGIATGASDIHAAEVDAQQCLDIAPLVGRSGEDVDLRSLASFSLLTRLRPDDLDSFSGRYLERLTAYDRTHRTELLRTVDAYLEANGSIERTAIELHIHPSTLKYRLKRVGELTQLSLGNPEDRLCLTLALRIARLRSRPRSPGG